jgi:hypothetical protein
MHRIRRIDLTQFGAVPTWPSSAGIRCLYDVINHADECACIDKRACER